MPTTSTGSSWRLSGRSVRTPRAEVPRAALQVAAELREAGVRPSRRLGQSFLTDPFVADAEAALVEVPPGVPLVEIGPGLGILTRALLHRGLGPLTLIESDARLARYLDRALGKEVAVSPADAVTARWPPMGGLVGNLPFSVATAIVLRALSERIPRWVFLVQREVGERLTASEGTRAYGRLTIWAALHGSIEKFLPVPARAFYPVPKVDGVVVRFRSHPGPLPVKDLPAFENLLRGLFSQRRKQLGNVLPALVGPRAAQIASEAEWPATWPTLRPENIPPEAYFRLANLAAPQLP